MIFVSSLHQVGKWRRRQFDISERMSGRAGDSGDATVVKRPAEPKSEAAVLKPHAAGETDTTAMKRPTIAEDGGGGAETDAGVRD